MSEEEADPNDIVVQLDSDERKRIGTPEPGFSRLLYSKSADMDAQLRSETVKSTPELSYGINRAIAEVTQLVKDAGKQIPTVPEVLVLPPNVYKDKIGGSRASRDTGRDPVFVRADPEMPAYILATFAFHELSLRYLDLTVHTYTRLPDTIQMDLSRMGLSVRASTPEGRDPDFTYGEFLNELGNVALEKRFLSDLLRDPAMIREALVRRRQLTAHNIPPGGKLYFLIPDDSETEYPLYFDLENIHFTTSGEEMVVDNQIIRHQLVTELENAYGLFDGLSFSEAMLRAKADVKYQNVIRSRLNEVFGEHFYEALRRVDYSSSEQLAILQWVQGKTRPAQKAA